MARKNLLQGLTADTSEVPSDGPALLASRRSGAIGAVGKSFAEMRANAVIEIPGDLIDVAGLEDRLGDDPEQAALIASLEAYGQQVPVLVRHSPHHEGRYEIVYGRRRAAALRKIGRPVRAMVRDLPDRELIVAQGQENSARRDLSFIEKANFARQMAELAFDRKVIADALHVDKTQLSRMLMVCEAVPVDVIRVIGPAPTVGRDRWVALARAMEGRTGLALQSCEGIDDSDARFDAVARAMRPPKAPAPPRAAESAEWGRVSRKADGVTITLPPPQKPFADWLLRQMDHLHARWASEERNQREE